MKKNRSFTLIEMLIVTALLAVISLALYATFNNGIKIWQRVNQAIPAQDLDIFFEKFTSDLRNSLKLNNLSFSGKEDQFEFAALVNSRRLGKTTVGKIQYRYDYNKGDLLRGETDYSDIYNNQNGLSQIVLSNVKSLKFGYYIYDSEKQKYLWQNELLEQNPSLAVRIELELKNNDQANKFIKTVGIPVS